MHEIERLLHDKKERAKTYKELELEWKEKELEKLRQLNFEEEDATKQSG